MSRAGMGLCHLRATRSIRDRLAYGLKYCFCGVSVHFIGTNCIGQGSREPDEVRVFGPPASRIALSPPLHLMLSKLPHFSVLYIWAL